METTHPEHHLHLRKIISKNPAAYPHPEPWKRWLDRAIYVIGILSPLMTIPQAVEVWETRNVTSLSLVTWGTYVVSSTVWVIYGITHKEKPIIISNTLLFIVNTAIAAGILLFR